MSLSIFQDASPTPLIYTELGENQFTNILLIDREVNNYQQFTDSVNSSTFPIVYSKTSSKTELLTLLQTNFTIINRIGVVFTSSLGNPKMFLDRKSLFNEDEEIEPYSENVQFILNLIKEFQVKNIDFLACDTLNYSNWVNYYQILSQNTGVVVCASNNKTGNIKYGGDWVMESTSQDIEYVYFTKSIEYYQYLLDSSVWSTGYNGDIGQMVFYGGYMYFPNYNTNTIIQVNLNGTFNNISWATTTQGLSGPDGCTVSGNYLYVTNVTNNTISKISLTNPTSDFTTSWATTTQGLSRSAITIVGDYLYSVNANTATMSKISLTNPTTVFTTSWATSAQGVSYSLGITYFNNYFYLSVIGGKIAKISLTNPTTDFDANWATSAQGLNNTVCVTIKDNYIYASNYTLNTICKISLTNPTTDFNSTWATFNTSGTNTGVDRPWGLTTYVNDLYVYNGTPDNILQINLPIPSLPCFKEGSKILTDQGYKPIQDLRKGDLIKTLKHGYLPIDMIGFREMVHQASNERIQNQLYQCSQSEYPEIFEPLVLTGCHSILVDWLTQEQGEKTMKDFGRIFMTDDKIRLIAYLDEKATVYEVPGNYTIYHIALENEHYTGNYGIYANGLLVESCSKRYLKEESIMELIE
jgi:hypothetical protein